MKQILDLMKEDGKDNFRSMERIVDRFMDRMAETMGEDFRKLGIALKEAGDAHNISTRSNRELLKAVEVMMVANQDLQEKMADLLEKHEKISEELEVQKQELKTGLDEISKEVNSQLYAFDKMRNLYEK